MKAGIRIGKPQNATHPRNRVFENDNFEATEAEAFESFNVEAAYFFSLEPSLFYNQAYLVFFMALIRGTNDPAIPKVVMSKIPPAILKSSGRSKLIP